jgi:hypothetical protein
MAAMGAQRLDFSSRRIHREAPAELGDVTRHPRHHRLIA